jgi:HAD superfamily hydrolase (TIGR01509 family)
MKTPPRPIPVDGVVFDCDGVLVDSLASVDRAWRRWSIDYGLDAESVLAVIHGQPTRDSVPTLVPAAEVEAALRRVDDYELEDAAGVTALPGAAALLASLPPGRWAIVTSASRALFRARLRAAGLSEPAVVVTVDDVVRGKPHPEGYVQAMRRLGVAPQRTGVFEDSAGGIAAAIASGAGTVIRVGSGEPGPGQAAVIADLRSVRWQDGLILNPDGEPA